MWTFIWVHIYTHQTNEHVDTNKSKRIRGTTKYRNKAACRTPIKSLRAMPGGWVGVQGRARLSDQVAGYGYRLPGRAGREGIWNRQGAFLPGIERKANVNGNQRWQLDEHRASWISANVANRWSYNYSRPQVYATMLLNLSETNVKMVQLFCLTLPFPLGISSTFSNVYTPPQKNSTTDGIKKISLLEYFVDSYADT